MGRKPWAVQVQRLPERLSRARSTAAAPQRAQPAAGDLHVCFAVTEPDAGSDTSRIRTFARRDGSDYVINGRKVWITKAAQSQKAVLLACTGEPGEGGRPTTGCRCSWSI